MRCSSPRSTAAHWDRSSSAREAQCLQGLVPRLWRSRPPSTRPRSMTSISYSGTRTARSRGCGHRETLGLRYPDGCCWSSSRAGGRHPGDELAGAQAPANVVTPDWRGTIDAEIEVIGDVGTGRIRSWTPRSPCGPRGSRQHPKPDSGPRSADRSAARCGTRMLTLSTAFAAGAGIDCVRRRRRDGSAGCGGYRHVGGEWNRGRLASLTSYVDHSRHIWPGCPANQGVSVIDSPVTLRLDPRGDARVHGRPGRRRAAAGGPFGQPAAGDGRAPGQGSGPLPALRHDVQRHRLQSQCQPRRGRRPRPGIASEHVGSRRTSLAGQRVMLRPVAGPRGIFSVDQVLPLLNKGGTPRGADGIHLDREHDQSRRRRNLAARAPGGDAGMADDRGLRLHMDAGLNAAVASGIPAATFASYVDSVWVDLSRAWAPRSARSWPVPRSSSNALGC